MSLDRSTIITVVCFCAASTSAQTPAKRTPQQMQASYDAHKGDFDYLLGDWEFSAESRDLELPGYWSACTSRWRSNSSTSIESWATRARRSHVTSTLRNYNKVLDRWELVGMDAENGLQDVGTGGRVGAEIHIEQRSGVMSDRPSTWKIRYYDIQPDRFSWIADRSTDGGKTWQAKHQTIDARRIGPPARSTRSHPRGALRLLRDRLSVIARGPLCRRPTPSGDRHSLGALFLLSLRWPLLAGLTLGILVSALGTRLLQHAHLATNVTFAEPWADRAALLRQVDVALPSCRIGCVRHHVRELIRLFTPGRLAFLT